MRNPSEMINYSKSMSIKKKELALNVINEMFENSEPITFYSVRKKTGFSKSFLYNHQEIRERIIKNRTSSKLCVQLDKRDEVIKKLRDKVRSLEHRICILQKDELWEEKYKIISAENKELKKQLEVAYQIKF